MTSAKIEPQRILTNFLRSYLTDINASRSGNWIYPDFPRVESLGDNQFPRIGISLISESAEPMGIFDDNQNHTILLQIDVVTKKDLVNTLTVTDEALGTMASTVNSDRFTFNSIPTTVTNIKHATTAYGTVTLQNTNADFTSPASLSADEVEYSFSTGDLNFSSADVSSHDGEAITSTYTVNFEGEKAVKYLARQIWIAIKNNWRTDSTMNGLRDPLLISNITVPLDEELGIYRQTLELEFKMFNIGEGL